MRQNRRLRWLAIGLLVFGLLLTAAHVPHAQGQPGHAPAALPTSGALALYAVNPLDPINLLIDPAGDVWFSSFNTSAIGKLEPGTGRLTSFAIPGNVWGLQREPSGRLWYSTGNRDAIGRLDPAAGTRQEWAAGLGHFGLDLAPSGDVWFDNGPQLARLTPATNIITRWTVFPPLAILELQIDANGDLWFTSRASQAIARFNPATERVTIWSLPAGVPYRLYVEAPDAIWVTQDGLTPYRVARLTPSTNTLSEYVALAQFSGVGDLLRSGDSVWFTEGRTDRIGRLDLTSAAPKTTNVQPTSFVAARASAVITPATIATPPAEAVAPVEHTSLSASGSGGLAEFALPLADSTPIGIIADQSSIWFSASTGNRIGRLQTPPPALAIAPANGAPGSFFQLAGSAFPANSRASVIVNGHTLSDTLAIDPSGAFALQLDTSAAEAGRYFISVSDGSFEETVELTLDPAFPVRPGQGGAPAVVVPPGIAFNRFVYLPVARR